MPEDILNDSPQAEQPQPVSSQFLNQTPSEPPKKPKRWIFVVGALIIVAVVIFMVSSGSKPQQQTATIPSQTIEPSEALIEPSAPQLASTPYVGDVTGWKMYKNDEYNFSFKYPSGWVVKSDAASDSEPLYTVIFEESDQKVLSIDIWNIDEAAPTSLEQEKSNLTKKAEAEKFMLISEVRQVGGYVGTVYNYVGIKDETFGKQSSSVIVDDIFFNIKNFSDSAEYFTNVLGTIKFN